jgi:hypothetical protein
MSWDKHDFYRAFCAERNGPFIRSDATHSPRALAPSVCRALELAQKMCNRLLGVSRYKAGVVDGVTFQAACQRKNGGRKKDVDSRQYMFKTVKVSKTPDRPLG